MGKISWSLATNIRLVSTDNPYLPYCNTSFCSPVSWKKTLRIHNLCCVWGGRKTSSSHPTKARGNKHTPVYLCYAPFVCVVQRQRLLLPGSQHYATPTFQGGKPWVPGPCSDMQKTQSADCPRIHFSDIVCFFRSSCQPGDQHSSGFID